MISLIRGDEDVGGSKNSDSNQKMMKSRSNWGQETSQRQSSQLVVKTKAPSNSDIVVQPCWRSNQSVTDEAAGEEDEDTH